MPSPDAGAVPAERIEAAFDRRRLVRLVSDSVRIKSFSGDEAAMADHMAARLQELGLEVERHEVAPHRANVVARWRGRGGAPSLMYNGHIDTNPAGEGWTHDPLGGDVDENFVYGIGVSNMKASNGCFLHALEMLRHAGFEPRGDILAAFVVGELQGGIGTVRLLESGLRADYFIVGEPTELTLLTRHAASFVFEIRLYGRTRHLSKAGEAIDAIAKMERLMPRLRHLVFSGCRGSADRELNRINIGVVRCGVSEELLDWRPQQVADVCLMRCAGRFGPAQTLPSAMSDIQALLDAMTAADPEFRADLRLVENNRIFMPPFEVAEDAAPVQALAAAHRSVTGSRPKVGAHTPAKLFGSDAAHLAKAGMTGLLYGAGGTYNTMPDERVAIAEMEIAARVYARAVATIAG